MTRRVRPVMAAVFAVLALGAPIPAAGQAAPTLALDRTGTAAGEDILVTGTGWPSGTVLVVELCGQGARNGSVSCDVPNQRVVGVAGDGSFRSALTVGRPPVPCPCVVHAVDQNGSLSLSTPISVQGMPSVPLEHSPPDPQPPVEITEMSVRGDPHVLEWFGFPPERALELTVANNTDRITRRLRLSVTAGKGPSPSGFVRSLEVEPLDPGATRSYEVAVTLGALSVGEYTIAAALTGHPDPVVASRSTSSHPWGLLALVLVPLQLGLLAVRNRVRGRLEERAWSEIRSPEPAGELTAGDLSTLGDDRVHEAASDEHLDAMVAAFDPSQSVRQAGSDAIAEHRRESQDELDDIERQVVEELDQLRSTIAERKSTSLRVLEEARARADGIVASARIRADAVLALAEATRAEAEHALARSRVDAERLISSAERDVAYRLAEVELAALAILQQASDRSRAIAGASGGRLATISSRDGEQTMQVAADVAASIAEGNLGAADEPEDHGSMPDPMAPRTLQD